WRVYDASGALSSPLSVPLIARGRGGHTMEVRDASTWRRIIGEGGMSDVRESPERGYEARSGRAETTIEGDLLDRAMTRGLYAAVRLHRAHGVPLVTWEDGAVRQVDPWSVRLPEDPE